MSKYSTYLDNILLPVELAKKGKGHRSVMANFSVGVSSYVESSIFIPYFSSFKDSTLSAESLSEVAENVIVDHGLSSAEVCAKFDYPVDRLSATDYVGTMCAYHVGYQSTCVSKKVTKTSNFVYVTFSAAVNDIVPTLATITYVLGYDGVVPYFEDIIFNLERTVVSLIPAFSNQEREQLRLNLLNSKTTYSTITDLLDIYEKNSYITSCNVEVAFDSSILQTAVVYNGEWKRRQ